MSAFGLLLVPLVAILTLGTGLPVYVTLLIGSAVGAVAGLVSGATSVDVLRSVVARLVNLLENDLLQALPLFILMGALLNRLPAAAALFNCAASVFRFSSAAPVASGFAIGALLGPMSGSVGASVGALTRSVEPKLAAAGVPSADRNAVVAIAGTLGVVVPPSLVLILLGDALLFAHTMAINVTRRPDRVINTQDLMRGALVPALLFVLVCLAVAVLTARRREAAIAVPRPTWRDVGIATASLLFLVALLGGVATGRFYAVEAAAMGAVVLLAWFLLTGGAAGGGLTRLLDEVMIDTGTLFAPLLAATTFTLVLRLLESDKLVEAWVSALPGGEFIAVIVILTTLAVLAVALDAFEIIFVAVPILVPALLIKVADATWVGVLVLLVLQASFLLPPIGYAWVLSRAALPQAPPARDALRAMWPYLAGQVAVLAAVAAFPALVHLLDPPGVNLLGPAPGAAPADTEAMLRQLPPAPQIGAMPQLQIPPAVEAGSR
jgi:tripartite ATP-independent transporter DctM subunit